LYLKVQSKKSIDLGVVLAQSTLSDGNMSFARGAANEVIANRRRFLSKFGLELDDLTAAGLAHGTECRLLDNRRRSAGAFTLQNAIPNTDGLITAESDLILAVTTADCLPIFLYDDDCSIIGIAHAGWQGLANGIVKNLIKSAAALKKQPLKRFYVKIGVSVGKCCYIVDAERLKRFAGLPLCEIHHRDGAKVHLDLKRIAAIQLERQGIPAENIEIESKCSACGGNYPSFRRDGDSFITDIAFIVKRSKYQS